jgi:hypothetical protein
MDVYMLSFSVSFDGFDIKFSLIIEINVSIKKYKASIITCVSCRLKYSEKKKRDILRMRTIG